MDGPYPRLHLLLCPCTSTGIESVKDEVVLLELLELVVVLSGDGVPKGVEVRRLVERVTSQSGRAEIRNASAP
jgi:hypothetical protein